MKIYLISIVIFVFSQYINPIFASNFKFAFAGHVRPKNYHENLPCKKVNPLLPEFIEEVNKLSPDFVIFGGDNVPGYLRSYDNIEIVISPQSIID